MFKLCSKVLIYKNNFGKKSKDMLIQKLPKYFQTNPLVSTLARLFEGKKIMFSSIVYSQSGKNYIINKNSQTPYFQVDWQCYSFIRCLANTLITTGSVIRYQTDVFKSHFVNGDQNIEQMYKNFRGNQRQNVFVMTNSMSKQQIKSHFNEEIYNLLDNDVLKEQKATKITLKQILQNLNENNLGPILAQCGPAVMKEYFSSIRNGLAENLIDGVYLAFFEGKLQKHSIGNQFSFDQDLYDVVWESQKFDINHQNKHIGKVHFKVYNIKHLKAVQI